MTSRSALRSLTGLCAMINTRDGDIAREIVEKANEQQKIYDAETRHGLTQGTAFGAGQVRRRWHCACAGPAHTGRPTAHRNGARNDPGVAGACVERDVCRVCGGLA